METISREFIETYDIKGIKPSFSIIDELEKLGSGIIFQGCEGYGFVGLACDGSTYSAVFIINSLSRPSFSLVPIENLDEYFIANILPNI